MAAISLMGDGGHDVGQEFHEVAAFMNSHFPNCSAGAIAFDSQEELLWVGSESGQISSYFGPELHRYTAFQGHLTDVKQISPDVYGVLSLTSNQVRYTTRQGLKLFLAVEESMQYMQCMVHYDSNYVTLAGHQDRFYEVDMTSGELYQRELEIQPNIVMMKHSNHFLCCGDSEGKVTLRDPDTLSSLHVLEAHGQTLSDFAVHGDVLVTTGFSSRYGHMSVDRYLMVYDLRTLRAFPPLQVPIDPYLVHFLPTYTTRCVVVSQTGEFLLCQPEGLVYDSLIYQTSTNGAVVMGLDISSTFQALAFSDSAGCIHIWSDRGSDELMFNSFSQPTLFTDEHGETRQNLLFDDYTIPLSCIELPDSSDVLLSDWPENLMRKVDRKTPDIDPTILENMTVRQLVGYSPNPKSTLRNQVAYKLDNRNWNEYTGTASPESPLKRNVNSRIPKAYRKVDIKYSKYGIDNFDFQHYNATRFAGLEIHIPNAYCNSMLQVVYFLEPMRVALQNHICDLEFCLACELGFLFRMLDIAEDQTCQATNFLRAFRTIRKASALGLILSDVDDLTRSQSLPKVIQNWFRFLLQQIHQDTAESHSDVECNDEKATNSEKETSVVKRLFGSKIEITKQCKCGKTDRRETNVFLFDMHYPEIYKDNDPDWSFASLLQNSISKKQQMPAWCEECQKYQSTTQTRQLQSLPDVLSINCRLDQPREQELWTNHVLAHHRAHGKPHRVNVSPPKAYRQGKGYNRPGCKFAHGKEVDCSSISLTKDGNPHFFALFLKIELDQETYEVTVNPVDNKYKISDESDYCALYRLSSVVSSVQDSVGGNTLIAAVHVSQSYHDRKEDAPKSGWYIFNDFAVTPVSECEAVDFSADWKTPCCLVYTRYDLAKRCDDMLTVEKQIDPRVLISEASLAQRQTRFSKQFTPLNSSELPLREGELVGIDAEFVTLYQEESEMRSDGTLSTVKPSHLCAARITVVRGWGTLLGVPFIDDYISTSEQVVDYLTKFSGIKPGDLDANMSSKHLTTLKTTYLKLLHLIDSGMVFVGHGLKKDFRVINIVVPRDQTIDTAELFRRPNQRYISLKFLAWHFLNIKIQSDSHDSTEDAYTALKLFLKYKEITECSGERQFEKELEVLYETGRQFNWQIPE